MSRLSRTTRNRIVRVRCASAGLALPGTAAVNRCTRVIGSSTSLHPFAHPALPGVNAHMGALTPVQSVLRTGRVPQRGNPAHERRHCHCTGLPALRVWPSEHSVLNHLTAPTVALAHNPSARQAFGTSPLASRLVGRPGRNRFVILRTVRSPPVASHPSSRRRSYFQLQAGVCKPGEDSHLSDQTRSQAH